jgi:predicted permease
VSICFFGLFPAWRGSRLDLNAELKGTSTIEAHSVAALIPVTVQIALSVLLLAASGLMLHSYWNLENLNPGFDRMHVLSFTLGIKDANFTPEQTSSYMAELLHRVEQLPGIRAAAFSNHGVMRGAGVKTIVTTPGVNQPASVYLNTTVVSVSPTYFETLGIPLLSGRVLEPFDSQMRPKPIVINRALASLLFPHVNPIGKFLVQGADGTKAPTAIIVGMVETAKFRTMQESATPTYYSLLTDEDYQLVLYLRTIGDPSSLIRPAEDAIRASASGVPLIEMAPLEQEVQNSLWQERLVARLASFFSVIALLLAGIGLYGTLAYSVSRRKRELGIRLAIGARVRDIIGTVCGRMTWAVAIGLATGLAIATVTLRLARAFLFGVEPIDQLSFAAATAAVLLCSALAALFPSWLAIRTDPAAALREE